jgi:hypothetical protein
VSQPSGGVPSFHVVYSGRCQQEAKTLLARAMAKGRFAEFAQAMQDIDVRLRWIPLDFGEPLRDFAILGIKQYVGSVRPLAGRYGVDEARRIVYLVVPFQLLPNSGL